MEQQAAVAENTHAAHTAVHCEQRRSFALRLAFTAQLMARSLVRGTQQHEHAPGAICQVQHP